MERDYWASSTDEDFDVLAPMPVQPSDDYWEEAVSENKVPLAMPIKRVRKTLEVYSFKQVPRALIDKKCDEILVTGGKLSRMPPSLWW